MIKKYELPDEVIEKLDEFYGHDEWKLLHLWVRNGTWLLTCYSNYTISFIRVYKGIIDEKFYLQLDETVELP